MKERLYNNMNVYTVSQREVEKIRALGPVEEFISSVYTVAEMNARKDLILQGVEELYEYYSRNTLEDLEEDKPVAEDEHIPTVLL